MDSKKKNKLNIIKLKILKYNVFIKKENQKEKIYNIIKMVRLNLNENL